MRAQPVRVGRSVAGVSARSAFTISSYQTPISKAIALLRSVGGRMLVPGLSSRVLNDGSGLPPVMYDPIGRLPDRVTGGLGPNKIVNALSATEVGGWSANTISAATVDGAGFRITVAQYGSNTEQKVAVTPGVPVTLTATYKRGDISTSTTAPNVRTSAYSQIAQLPIPTTTLQTSSVTFTPTENFVWIRFWSGGTYPDGSYTYFENVSIREVTAATQATTGFKPKLIREPILGPELMINGSGGNTSGWTPTRCTVASVGGEFVLTVSGAVLPNIKQTVSTVVGKSYRLTTSQRQGTTTFPVSADITGVAGTGKTNSTTVMTQFSRDFIATSDSSVVSVFVDNTSAVVGSTAIFDNISVREILGYTERYSLEFDGVDDYMAASSAATLSDGLVMVWAGKQLSAAAGKRLLAGWDTTTLNEFGIGTTATGGDVRLRVSGYSEFGALSLPISIGSATVITIKLTATNVSARFNGGAWSNAAHGRVLPNTVLALGLGARSSGPLPANCIMSASMVANLGANATDANIAILERAAAQLAGVTL